MIVKRLALFLGFAGVLAMAYVAVLALGLIQSMSDNSRAIQVAQENTKQVTITQEKMTERNQYSEDQETERLRMQLASDRRIAGMNNRSGVLDRILNLGVPRIFTILAIFVVLVYGLTLWDGAHRRNYGDWQ